MSSSSMRPAISRNSIPPTIRSTTSSPSSRSFPAIGRATTSIPSSPASAFSASAYNTDAITEKEASSYNVYWAEKLKGKVGHFDWHLPNLGQISLLNGNASPYDIDEAAWAALQEKMMTLRPQIGGFFDYGGTFSSLQNGQMLAMAGIGDWITGALEKNGAKVRTIIPEEGGLQFTESFSIGKGSPKADLAKKWIQYITSAKGQVKSANMAAYPCLIPNKNGWELLATETPEEAKRQGMLLDERATPWT